MTIEAEGQRLRREIALLPPGRTRRYSPELRKRTLRWVARARAAGMTQAGAGAEIGVPIQSLVLWRSRSAPPTPRARRIVPVEVVADPSSQVAVVTPSGLRLEGLTIEQAIAVLRAVG